MLNISGYSDLLGAPFKYGGRSINEGFDCFTLAQELYRRSGIYLPHYASSEDFAEISASITDGKKHLIELQQPEHGCLVLFIIRPPYVSHIGVMLDSVRFIHIMQKRSVCIERIDSLEWQHRVRGFYRYADSQNS